MGLPLTQAPRPLTRRAVAARLPRPLRFALGLVTRQWRRSIQLRVVAATVVLGILVVLVVGQLLLQRITSGIIESRQDAVVADATQNINQAKPSLISGSASSHDIVNQLAG